MMPEFTATEIAELICRADGLQLTDQSVLLNRIKYIAKREILVPSRQLDKRGTLAFASLEVYRAAIFCELIGLAMDVRALEAVTNAASRKHFDGDRVAPSQVTETGARVSRGALNDAVRGVAAGESWFLKLWRVNPGHAAGESIQAAFVHASVPDSALWGNARVDQVFGRKPSRAHVVVDLAALFGPLIPLAGVAD